MGYTHYFKMPKPQKTGPWMALVDDVGKLMGRLPTAGQLLGSYGIDTGPITLCGPHGSGEPICNANEIAFNGDASLDMASETLLLLPKKIDDYCKTARHPYDFVVCGVLALANHHLPRFDLRSDGDTEEWRPALDWLQKHINPDVVMPTGIRPTAVSPAMSARPTAAFRNWQLPLDGPGIADAYF